MWLNLLRSPLTWLLIPLVIVTGGWIWSHSAAITAEGKVTTLQTDLKATQQQAETAARQATADRAARDATIATLYTELTAQTRAATALQGQIDQLAMTAATRADTIKRLKRENAQLQEWADRPLPDPVIRLLQRPALTGAADYQAQLSGPDPVPAATGQPGQ